MTPSSERASGDALDLLVERALDVLENEGDAGLERLFREDTTNAAALRARIEALRATGLLDARPSSTPERLGAFKLIRPLGAGGMGIVYLAVQEDLGREVALKLIRPEHMFFPGARKRFRREVEVIARLQHPGIVPIHTVGEENGIPYFAMELLRGETLETVLARLRTRDPRTLTGADMASTPGDTGYLFAGSWEDACLRVVRQVAEALEHAHGQGVLHRDLKPSNVLVTAGAASRAVLLDFGLATSSASGKLTRSGEQLGSLNYMAPEQLRGARDLDARSDVYSLGATLYELLTLQVAFGGAADTEILTAIERGTPRAIRALNANVSWDAETVCMTAMEHAPARRYASAADFARDLGNVLQRRPIEAKRAGSLHRARRWIERNPARAAALGLAALLVVGLPSTYAWQQRSAARAIAAQRDRAELNFERALAAVDRMLTRVGSVDLRFVPQMEPVRAAVLADAVELLDRFAAEEKSDPRARRAVAEANARLAQLHAALGHKSEASEAFARAAELYGELHAAEPGDEELTRTWLAMRAQHAHELTVGGQIEEALALHAELENELANASSDDPVLALERVSNRIAYSVALANSTRGRDVREELRDLLRNATNELDALLAGGTEHGETVKVAADAYNQLGLVLLRHFGEDDKPNPDAEVAFERAVELAETYAAGEPDDPDRVLLAATARGNLAGALRRGQQWDEALESYEGTRVELERLVERFPSTPRYKLELATVTNQLGLLREWRNQTEGVEALYARAVELLREIVTLAPREAPFWNLYGTAQVNLSSPLTRRGETAAAEKLILGALDAQRRALALAPRNELYEQSLQRTAQDLSYWRRMNGDHAGSAAIVEEIARELPERWKSWSSAAVQLSKLVEYVRDVAVLADDERERLAGDYGERAVTALRTALEKGAPLPKGLRDFTDFAPLHGLDSFEQLATELERTKP